MHNSFISVIGVINSYNEIKILPEYLKNIYGILKNNFTDFEIILVNNTFSQEFEKKVNPLPSEIKQNIYVLNLATVSNKNHAVLAGLDRANGDYTVLFEFDFYKKPEIIIDLYKKSRGGFDIVYLKAKERSAKIRFKLFYSLFYYIMRKYSDLKIDDKAHNTRIISRRALNSLLRLRENLRYMKAIYSIVGYKTDFIEVDEPLMQDPDVSFSEQFKTSTIAITSFTTFLRTLLFWIFIFSIVFMIAVIANALKVKILGTDVFGNPAEEVAGWTFLVVMISIFFAFTSLNLYILSIYLSNIYTEIKNRPMYIIESIKRF